jgi:hypothetical protein
MRFGTLRRLAAGKISMGLLRLSYKQFTIPVIFHRHLRAE